MATPPNIETSPVLQYPTTKTIIGTSWFATTITAASLTSKTITIKDGLITGFS